MDVTQCKCNDYSKWFVKRFGHNGFVVLCRTCGKNATEAAEKRLGISLKHDDYDMACNHLQLAQYEKSQKVLKAAENVATGQISLTQAIKEL